MTDLIRPPRPDVRNISGLHVWYDASQEVVADGTALPTIADRSGNGRHATQAVSGKEPTFDIDGTNGRPGYRHTAASQQFVKTASWGTLAQPFTFFVVANFPAITQTLFDGLVSSPRAQFTATSILRMYSGTNISSLITPPQNAAIWEVCYDGANSYLAQNGAVVLTGSAGTLGTTGLTIGAFNDGAQLFYNGVWSELALYSKRLTDAERRHVLKALG